MEILPQLFAAALMVMGLYEKKKRRVEHNMLALSNVNLATSGFVGPEIQQMLSHALERVLSVVAHARRRAIPASWESEWPNFCGRRRANGKFLRRLTGRRLDDHLVDLVARLGGLVVFRDLGRDASWVALESEEAFRRFRQLATSQHLRTVVGISLQAKEQAFGRFVFGNSR